MKLLKFFSNVFLLSSMGLSAHLVQNDISLVGGYQHGKFKQEFANVILEPFTSATYGPLPAGIVSTEDVTSRIDLGVFGVQGRYFFPQLDCFCEGPSFLNNLYLTGHAIWGWGNKDRFKDTYVNLVPSGQELPEYSVLADYEGRGKLKKTRSYDYNIGLGYVLDLDCLDCFDLSNWSIGVEGGYSYRKLELTTKNGDDGQLSCVAPDLVNYFLPDDPGYRGVKFRNQWQGGWVGAQLFYTTCDWNINVGYAYHISRYTGVFKPTLVGIEESGFTYVKGKSNHAHANVWTVNANYDLFCGWYIGGLFTYENWHAKKGSNRAVAPPPTQVLEEKTYVNTGWNAYTIAAKVGYAF